MANIYKPLTSEITSGDSAGTGVNVSLATNVRAVNTNTTTAYTVGVADSATALGQSVSMTLPPNEIHLIRKLPGDVVYASNTAVKFCKITNPDG